MSSHGNKEVHCSFCPGQGHWITHNRRPVFVHVGRCNTNLPILARSSYRGNYRSFTHPIRCRDCGRPCFIYHNSETEVWVIFDSLGPPWPKHSCADKSAPSPLGWQSEGFIAVHILDAFPDPKYQTLTLQIKLLDSGKKMALKLSDRKDNPRIQNVITNPFHVKQLSHVQDVWLLNTFESVGESVWPKTFKCEEVPFQGTLPLA